MDALRRATRTSKLDRVRNETIKQQMNLKETINLVVARTEDGEVNLTKKLVIWQNWGVT